jgi:hypothetical protein
MYGLLLIALWMATIAMRGRRRVMPPTAVPVFFALSLVPQNVPTRTVSAAEAEFRESFTTITSVRVLSDGRVLVADSRDKTLQVIDLRSQTARAIGRTGSGPGEYAVPSRLIALPGDTTLLADPANSRYLQILPNGAPGRTISLADLGDLGRNALLKSVDRQGRLYFEQARVRPGALESPTVVDVIRFDLRTGTADTLASLALPAGRVEGARMLPGGMIRRLNSKPFALEDVSAISPVGRVAVARARDYHVEWIQPDGGRIAGPATPYSRIKVTSEEREAFLTSQTRPGQIVVTGPGGGNASGAPAAPKAMPIPRGASPIETTPIDWPQHKAPFPSAAAVVADDGRLWVLAARVHDDPVPRYDVFNERGLLVQRVALPRRTRLVAFGPGVVWLARTDDDDLQWLGRYRY